MIKCLGQFQVKPNKQIIVLSDIVLKSDFEWKDTLLHELVHAWQHQSGLEICHGDSFKNKAKKISSISEYNISRNSDSEFLFKEIELKREQRKLKKESNTTQFIAVDVWGLLAIFYRKLTKKQVDILKEDFKIVYENSNPIEVNYCENFSKRNNTHNFYDRKDLNKMIDLSTCKKL
jgi:hypothetical protein